MFQDRSFFSCKILLYYQQQIIHSYIHKKFNFIIYKTSKENFQLFEIFLTKSFFISLFQNFKNFIRKYILKIPIFILFSPNFQNLFLSIHLFNFLLSKYIFLRNLEFFTNPSHPHTKPILHRPSI